MSHPGRISDRIAAAYFTRIGQPRGNSLDAQFQMESRLLMDMLHRAEEAMEGQAIPEVVIEGVLRHMLYGAPDPGEAEARMVAFDVAMKIAMDVPPRSWTIQDLGLLTGDAEPLL